MNKIRIVFKNQSFPVFIEPHHALPLPTRGADSSTGNPNAVEVDKAISPSHPRPLQQCARPAKGLARTPSLFLMISIILNAVTTYSFQIGSSTTYPALVLKEIGEFFELRRAAGLPPFSFVVLDSENGTDPRNPVRSMGPRLCGCLSLIGDNVRFLRGGAPLMGDAAGRPAVKQIFKIVTRETNTFSTPTGLVVRVSIVTNLVAEPAGGFEFTPTHLIRADLIHLAEEPTISKSRRGGIVGVAGPANSSYTPDLGFSWRGNLTPVTVRVAIHDFATGTHISEGTASATLSRKSLGTSISFRWAAKLGANFDSDVTKLDSVEEAFSLLIQWATAKAFIGLGVPTKIFPASLGVEFDNNRALEKMWLEAGMFERKAWVSTLTRVMEANGLPFFNLPDPQSDLSASLFKDAVEQIHFPIDPHPETVVPHGELRIVFTGWQPEKWRSLRSALNEIWKHIPDTEFTEDPSTPSTGFLAKATHFRARLDPRAALNILIMRLEELTGARVNGQFVDRTLYLKYIHPLPASLFR